MNATPAPVGARLVDTVHLVTPAEAHGLKAAGVDGVAQYLGSVTAEGIQGIVDAGLGFTPVTYADQWDGPRAVLELERLGLPQGTVAWLDVEGVGPGISPAELESKINAWGRAVSAAGYIPGLYVGAQCPLTSAELFGLAVYRYWKGLSRITDRGGLLAEPTCGWAMVQVYPGNVLCAGVLVDYDIAGMDYQRRPLLWSSNASIRDIPTSPGRSSSSTSMRAVR